MQPPPTAADLLAAVAEVLDEAVGELRGPLQHRARVAASLVTIVERELRLGPAADDAERAALADLLGPTVHAADLVQLRDELARRLRAGWADDADTAERVRATLLEAVRADLAISKPGHDDWDGD